MKKIILLPVYLFFAFFLPAQSVSFTDQSALLGPVNGASFLDCTVDMNGDYLDDVVRVTFNDRMYIDYQQPDGSFHQQIFNLSVQNEPDWSICAGDLDNNGFNDLLFGGGGGVSFILANDSGTDYSETPMPGYIFSQRSTMADIDNDGDLDAFVCHDTDQSIPYRNDGNGNMTPDYNLIQTYDRPGNYAAIWTDYDNDGDIDLYITKCKGGAIPGDIDRTNLLYRNNGDGTFTEVAEVAGLADNAQSWTTVFEDFDNDGDFDAFIVNHDFQNRFYRNNGDGTFTDIIDQTGIDPNDLGAWENAAGDFNNDGFVDIFSELSYSLYLNNGDGTFTGQFVPITPGGIGDFNNDGFLDVLRNNKIWVNDGNNNNWLKINTIGIQSNRNGIGARVEIYGQWGIQVREVRSGQSFSPMSSLQVHFGLGQADTIDKVVVRWPSGIVTTVDHPPINQTLNIFEAECLLPPAEITLNGPDSLCPGQTVELTAPDGFASYSWSTKDTTHTIIVDQAGKYYVLLTDTSGCVSISEEIVITLIEETPPVINMDGPDFFCEGSSIILFTNDGPNPVWSNGTTGNATIVDQTGQYTVSVDGLCTQPLTSNPVTITELDAPEPQVNDLTIAQGDSVQITATGNDPHWYDMPTGGTLLGTGNTFTTPPLDQTTTFFVETHNFYPGELQNGGKPDNSGGGGLSSQPSYLIFTAWEPFRLVSVRVYVPSPLNAGDQTIRLTTSDGTVLQEKTINLPQGEHVVELNFDVPEGENLTLRHPENNFYRNNNGVHFPYPIGDAGLITTTPFGTDFYYYFYDWKVQKEDFLCISDRVPVTVTVTNAIEAFAQAGFALYPNPANEELFVEMKNPARHIALLNTQGRAVWEKSTPTPEGVQYINTRHLPAGLYLLRIAANGEVYYGKVVVE